MRCGHCSGEHDSVQEVRDCAMLPPTLPDRRRPATERQIDYAQALVRQRQTYGSVQDIELTNSLEAACEFVSAMDFEQISEFIGNMKTQPKREEKVRTVKVLIDEGMYKKNGGIFKVQRAHHGSGHLYVKRLEKTSSSGKFIYAPGMLAALTPEDKMTTREAKEFGALYGFCCVCGRILTDEDSISAGIGPICGAKEGWFA